MPNAQAKMRDMNESMIWWFQALDSTRERLNCCRYSGQLIKNTGVQHMQQRVQSTSAHTTHIYGKKLSQVQIK